MKELPIIQKTYDLIQWYVPILSRLPKTHKFTLGDRITSNLYDTLEMLIRARYAQEKLKILEDINTQLDILRYQSRLLLDFKLISVERYQYISQLLQDIGNNLGGWIKQQKNETSRPSLSPNHPL